MGRSPVLAKEDDRWYRVLLVGRCPLFLNMVAASLRSFAKWLLIITVATAAEVVEEHATDDQGTHPVSSVSIL